MAILAVLALLIVLFMISAPRTFLGYRIYMAFLASVPPPIILALGLTFVVIAGEMDLSFPAIVAFASSHVFSALLSSRTSPWSPQWRFLAGCWGRARLGLLGPRTQTGCSLIVTRTELAFSSMIRPRSAKLAVLLGRPSRPSSAATGSPSPSRRGRGRDDDPRHLRRAIGASLSRAVAMGGLATAGNTLVHPHRTATPSLGENVLFLGDNARVARVVGIPVDAGRGSKSSP